MEPLTLAHNLRVRRKARRLSQAALAEAASSAADLPPFALSQQYIADLETGRNRNPSGPALLRIAAVLACDPADLYGSAPAEAVA